MAYKYLLFDLDGTLTDPKEGITKSVIYSLEKQNIETGDQEAYTWFIGPPLDDSYRSMGFDEEQIALSIRLYRERFEDVGWVENVPYEGVESMLEDLSKVYTLAIATSKPTVFAEKILDHFGYSKYFKAIVGSNLDRTRVRKAEVIEEALRQLHWPSRDEVLMIGDRSHDLEGALVNQIDAVHVLYGYGDASEHKSYQPVLVANDFDDLRAFLI